MYSAHICNFPLRLQLPGAPDKLDESEDVGDVSEVGCETGAAAGAEKSDESTSFTEVAAKNK